MAEDEKDLKKEGLKKSSDTAQEGTVAAIQESGVAPSPDVALTPEDLAATAPTQTKPGYDSFGGTQQEKAINTVTPSPATPSTVKYPEQKAVPETKGPKVDIRIDPPQGPNQTPQNKPGAKTAFDNSDLTSKSAYGDSPFAYPMDQANEVFRQRSRTLNEVSTALSKYLGDWQNQDTSDLEGQLKKGSMSAMINNLVQGLTGMSNLSQESASMGERFNQYRGDTLTNKVNTDKNKIDLFDKEVALYREQENARELFKTDAERKEWESFAEEEEKALPGYEPGGKFVPSPEQKRSIENKWRARRKAVQVPTSPRPDFSPADKR